MTKKAAKKTKGSKTKKPAATEAKEPLSLEQEVEEIRAKEQAEPTGEPAKEKLSKLTVEQLQARYLAVVGRPTGSTNTAYMIWKIREARKGRITVGPRKNAKREGVTYKVLPLRMEGELVDKLDDARARLGFPSRMNLFRKALKSYLTSAGEMEVAALLTD